jgi:hypothetical protein
MSLAMVEQGVGGFYLVGTETKSGVKNIGRPQRISHTTKIYNSLVEPFGYGGQFALVEGQQEIPVLLVIQIVLDLITVSSRMKVAA